MDTPQARYQPLSLPNQTVHAVRLNNLLLNKTVGYGIQLADGKAFRFRMTTGDIQTQQRCPISLTRELNVIAIEPGLERLLVQALGNTAGPALDPGVADILTQKAAEVALKQEEMGLPACLLVPDQIRNAISRLVRRVAPRLQVLAHSEIPETHTIRIGPILKGASA